MGVPLPRTECKDVDHVFVRGKTLDIEGFRSLHGFEVVACSHFDIAGDLVTEALVSGHGAHRFLQEQTVDFMRTIHNPHWIQASILAAAGRATESPGTVAVYALTALTDEHDLVSHPHALSGSNILSQVATVFEFVNT